MVQNLDNPIERVVIDPKVCHGRPVVRGTRVPVAVVLGHLAGGDSFERICAEYSLTDADIRACIGFANREVGRMTFSPTVTG